MTATQYSKMHTQRQQSVLLIAFIVGSLIVALLVVALCAYTYRKRWYVQKKLHELPIDEMTYINPDAPPNMARLRLINEDELKKGTVLGSGAFGVVFQVSVSRQV
jgi:hypothetical protein